MTSFFSRKIKRVAKKLDIKKFLKIVKKCDKCYLIKDDIYYCLRDRWYRDIMTEKLQWGKMYIDHKVLNILKQKDNHEKKGESK